MAFPHQNQITVGAIGLNVLPWLIIFGGCAGLFAVELVWLAMWLIPTLGAMSLIIGIWYERRQGEGNFHAGAFGCVLSGWVNLSLGFFTALAAGADVHLSGYSGWLVP